MQLILCLSLLLADVIGVFSVSLQPLMAGCSFSYESKAKRARKSKTRKARQAKREQKRKLRKKCRGRERRGGKRQKTGREREDKKEMLEADREGREIIIKNWEERVEEKTAK